MGEGPGAAETLNEFDEGVKKKGSAELLAASTSSFSEMKKPTGRARGWSLGRDSRFYGDSTSVEDLGGWGTDIEGIRVGECSALTGEGKSLSGGNLQTTLMTD